MQINVVVVVVVWKPVHERKIRVSSDGVLVYCLVISQGVFRKNVKHEENCVITLIRPTRILVFTCNTCS